MDILQSRYQSVLRLQDFLMLICDKPNIQDVLVQSTDPESYREFLTSVFVCVSKEIKACRVISLSQHFHQQEIVHRVIERLLRKKSSNLICLGYGLVNEISKVRSSTGMLEKCFSNSLVNRLFHSSWRTLLKRVGDEVMMFLLGSTSIFLEGSNSCFVQLTGAPVYDLRSSQSVQRSHLKSPPCADGIKRDGISKGKLGTKRPKKCSKPKAKANQFKNIVTLYRKEDKTRERKKRKYEDIMSEPKYLQLQETSRKFASKSDDSVDDSNEYQQFRVSMTNKKVLTPNTLLIWSFGDASCLGTGSCRNIGVDDKTVLHNNVACENVTGAGLVGCLDDSEAVKTEEDVVGGNRILKRNYGESFQELDDTRTVKKVKVTDHRQTYTDVSRSDLGRNNSGIHADCNGQEISRIESVIDVDCSGQAISKNESVIDVDCSGQEISKNESVIDIDCSGQEISEIESLIDINCSGQEISEIESLIDVKCSGQEISGIESVIDINCSGQEISEIESLIDVKCSGQEISGIKSLIDVKCIGSDDNRNKYVLDEGASLERNQPSVLVKEPCKRTNRKKKSKYVSQSEDKKKEDIAAFNFQPFLHSLCLNRTKAFYTRNVRERTSTSATISQVVKCSSADGVLHLCQAIFHDTPVLADRSSISIRLQTLQEVSSSLAAGDQMVTMVTGEPSDLDMNDRSHSESSQIEEMKEDISSTTVSLPASLYRPLLDFLQRLRRCPFKILLNKHCPVKHRPTSATRSSRRRKVSSPSMSMSSLLSDHSRPRQVYLFLRACLLRTLPRNLIGNHGNRNRLLKNVSTLLSMGKQDKMSLGQLMDGMKTCDVDWLLTVPSNNCRLHLLARLVHWIFSDYVQVLIRTYFYVTETTFLRYHLLYYRQVVWNRLHARGILDLVRSKIVKPVGKSYVQRQFQSKSSLGVSSLRFLPKPKALRPIINMGTVDSQLTNKKISVNKQLLNTHHILSHLQKSKPALVGHGLMGTSELHCAWKNFVQDWRADGEPALYFVKTDIAKCYDSILQTKMYEIMESLLRKEIGEDDLCVRKFVTVMQRPGQVQIKFRRQVSSLEKYNPDFVEFCQDLVQQEKMQDTVLVDKVLIQHEDCMSLLATLKQHLFNNIIRVGPHYYHHVAGISQGSIISTLLCNFYYADLERNLLETNRKELLLRMVDDCMFVTPSLESAHKYLATMLKGVSPYNCTINMDKVLTNFPVKDCPDIKVTSEAWFPWCGTMFNTRTLETAIDYTRYSGTRIEDTMSYDLSKQPGKAMKRKLLFALHQRCNDLYLDPALNSVDQRLVNLFSMFLMTAFRFMAFVNKLGNKHGVDRNPDFFARTVNCLACRANRIISEMQLKNQLEKRINCNQVVWLCYKAFQIKLKRRHAQFSLLLKMIRCKLSALEHKMKANELSAVERIVIDGLPADFRLIL